MVRTGDLAARLMSTTASATEMVQLVLFLARVPRVHPLQRATHRSRFDTRAENEAEASVGRFCDILPYDGNPHETACRLEHAIDDDMEVALSRLITPETKTPADEIFPNLRPTLPRLSKSSSSVR